MRTHLSNALPWRFIFFAMDNSTPRAVRTASLSSITSTARSPKLSRSPWSCLSFMGLDASSAEFVACLPQSNWIRIELWNPAGRNAAYACHAR